jgi:hypothetical protein
MKKITAIAGWVCFVASCSATAGEDLASLCADRAAIERVYYNHRLGAKPPFAEAMPPALSEQLVRQDRHKEAVLKRVYGVEITPPMLEGEVQRINSTTRAPEVLAELKAALGNDTNRFARTVARPLLVERTLRERFDNDDALHAPQRRDAEQARGQLLRAQSQDGSVARLLGRLQQGRSNEVTETAWRLGARPKEPPGAETAAEAELKQRFGPNAQVLSSPRAGGKEQKFYFEDLPGELQRVLRVQLRQPGDVSAVIEMPGAFLVYLCTEKTAEALKAAALSLPKRSYEQWLAEQEGETR